MPVVERAVIIRRRRVAAGAAVAAIVVLVLLGAYACSAAREGPTQTLLGPPRGAALGPPLGATAYGNDISWPQCPKGAGGYGLPGPLADATFVVVGLTDGGSFRANPCLASQVAWVRTHHLWAGAYAISTYPTAAQLARYGGTGTLLVRLARVGAAQAGFNLTTMARVGLRTPLVWIDIEPRTKSPWSASAVRNNAVIDGVIAGYRVAGVRAGIYSYAKAWRAITGSRVLSGVPTWVPVGRKGRAVAASTCALASYTGSRPWLVQWTGSGRDHDLTCPGVTGWAVAATS